MSDQEQQAWNAKPTKCRLVNDYELHAAISINYASITSLQRLQNKKKFLLSSSKIQKDNSFFNIHTLHLVIDT